jgi:ribonuclease P protein component
LLRESYRLNKQSLLQFAVERDKKVIVFLLWLDRSLPELVVLQNKMPVLLDKLIKLLSEKTASNT